MRTPGKVSAALAGAVIAIVAAPGAAGALTLGVTTKSPQDVAARSVTFAAEATVSVLGASVTWQYGTTTAYGATTGSLSTSLLGVKENLALPVAGLTPETTYHVRAVATSGLDVAYGRDVSFKTPKAKPGDPGTAPTAPTTPAPSDDDQGQDDNSSGSGSGSSGSSGSGSSSGGSSSGTSGTTKGTTTKSKSADDDQSSSSGSGDDAGDDEGDDGADPAADVPRGKATAPVTPVLGRTLAAAAVQGTVTATSPSGAPVDLSAARAVPTGTIIDARAGTVELTTALDRQGTTQTGRFWGGRFEVRQRAGDGGLTQLVLRGGDFGACPPAGTAARAAAAATKATKKKKPSRSLWGSDDHGRFQTHGRGSVATVRGTRWLTQDTCAGTLTKVLAGAVAVKDLRTGRTVLVRRGHQYRARVAS